MYFMYKLLKLQRVTFLRIPFNIYKYYKKKKLRYLSAHHTYNKLQCITNTQL